MRESGEREPGLGCAPLFPTGQGKDEKKGEGGQAQEGHHQAERPRALAGARQEQPGHQQCRPRSFHLHPLLVHAAYG